MKSRADFLVFAYERESRGVAGCLVEVSKLSTPWPRSLLSSIAANQAQHLVLLRQALGAGPLASVPEPFEAGTTPPLGSRRNEGTERMFPLNLPNFLTLMRILAVPVVVVALLGETPNGDALAAGVFALAALTDGLDGYFARSRDAVTTFGKLMDPFADKLLIVAALVSLVSLHRLEAWVAMVIIAREIAVTGLRAIAAERGIVIAASWLGKVKTVLQIAAVFALIAENPAPLWVNLLVYGAVAATIVSGADYFLGLRRRIEEEREARRSAPPATRA